MRIISLVIVVVLVLSGCAPKPYAATNKIYKENASAVAKQVTSLPPVGMVDSIPYATTWAGSVNFNIRKPNFVILHHTAQNSCDQTIKTFITEKTQVSSHYVICKDGTVHQMLNDYLRGWHAGTGRWGNTTDMNSVSLGIEIDNNGSEIFTEAQITSLILLLRKVKKAYNIPAANFIGHGDVAPGRKVDPSVFFPWKRLATEGFGLWYDDTTNVTVPINFDPTLALRIIGYDISQSDIAANAFRRHFIGIDAVGKLNDGEIKVLYQVMQKYK